jgi:hypothetical protein
MVLSTATSQEIQGVIFQHFATCGDTVFAEVEVEGFGVATLHSRPLKYMLSYERKYDVI